MSNECKQTPLIELLRMVSESARLIEATQWGEDGAETGHSMSPVGKLMHEAADEIERLQGELETCRGERDEARQVAGLVDGLEKDNALFLEQREKAEAENKELVERFQVKGIETEVIKEKLRLANQRIGALQAIAGDKE